MYSADSFTSNIGLNIAVAITVAVLALMVGIIIYRKLRANESLKYEFITIIAHKFRTPLTQIKWIIEDLSKSETDSYKKQALTDIAGSNDNLIKLTNTLVELTDKAGAAKSSYQMEKIDLCVFGRAELETYKKAFHEKNLFMSMKCAVPEAYVSADRARLEFVVGTLLENACNYTPPGRNITLTVSADNRKAAIAVTDDGIGIDDHDMPHLFTKFYRTKQAKAADTEGFGIGLYLAKSVVNRHGGKIEAFSEGSGRGSTFSVILPRVK